MTERKQKKYLQPITEMLSRTTLDLAIVGETKRCCHIVPQFLENLGDYPRRWKSIETLN